MRGLEKIQSIQVMQIYLENSDDTIFFPEPKIALCKDPVYLIPVIWMETFGEFCSIRYLTFKTKGHYLVLTAS